MELIEDISKNDGIIIKSIKKHGYCPEHNYYHYLYSQNNNLNGIFFRFEKYKGIMATVDPKSKIWRMIGEVMAPQNERIVVFKQFLECVMNKKKASKVFVEPREEFRREILTKLNNQYRISATNYHLTCPVYNLSSIDSGLPGNKWKKLRNIRNRFHKNYKISFKDAKSLDSNIFNELLKLWLKRRKFRDRVDKSYYKNVFNSGFGGFDIALSVAVNQIPCSISAGWRIPNSNSFYWGIGIHNYQHSNIGDFINLNDLLVAKENGYEYADLGGSGKHLLYHKMKFRAESAYKTYCFSIKSM